MPRIPKLDGVEGNIPKLAALRFGRKVSVACGGFLLAAASLLYGSFPHLAVFVVAETTPLAGRGRPMYYRK